MVVPQPYAKMPVMATPQRDDMITPRPQPEPIVLKAWKSQTRDAGEVGAGHSSFNPASSGGSGFYDLLSSNSRETSLSAGAARVTSLDKSTGFAQATGKPDFMAGEASKGDPRDLNPSNSPGPSYRSNTDRPAPSGHRTHSQLTAPRRQATRPAFQSPFGSAYPRPPSSDTFQSSSSSGARFRGQPPQFQSQGIQYAQPSSYGGPYTMSPQSPGNMQAHSNPAFQYGFPHHPGQYVHETPMISQNPHIAYSSPSVPPSMQHHSSAGPSGLFGHAQNRSPRSGSPLPSPVSQSASPHSAASFAGQTQYYHSPLSTPPFPYPPQSYPQSATLYQSPYSPAPYPPHYVPAGEQEGQQGTWWYVPTSMASPTQYEPMQHTYPTHYPVTYPSLSRPDVDSSYNQPGPSSAGYSMAPLGRHGPPSQPYFSRQTHGSTPPSLSQASSIGPPGSPDRSGAFVRAPSSSSVDPSSVRRSYHPNPPSQRSEWVMWVGNVPGDATVEELWRVFNYPGPIPRQAESRNQNDDDSDPGSGLYDGVISIHPIVRSNCAFVNFESEAHLHSAIVRFNGQPLRANDPKCPRLVCRVRAKEDDLKAGVGAQRGTGLHSKWVREQRDKGKEAAPGSGTPVPEEQSTLSPDGGKDLSSSTASSPRDVTNRVASLSVSSDDESRFRRGMKKSSSGSFASTNSSFLAHHFPKRYFILKSLTQFDLDLSVEKGLWATQRHNETVLDQAYRTSEDVYLIFGVNKSGEFYGYARMSGPILRGEQPVSWASRTDSSTSSQRGSRWSETIPEEDDGSSEQYRPGASTFFPSSENRLVDESPLPVSSPRKQILPSVAGQPVRQFLSAPPEMVQPHSRVSLQTIPTKLSLDTQAVLPTAPELFGSQSSENFELNPEAPARAARRMTSSVLSRVAALPDADGVKRVDMLKEEDEFSSSPLGPVAEEETKGSEKGVVGDVERGEVPSGEHWGEPFKIEWIRTTRLPFWRTRHLRNSWNHDREVKVSRDGTELEPNSGQALLEEWDRSDPPQSPVTSKFPGQGRRPTGEQKSASTNTAPTLSRKGDL